MTSVSAAEEFPTENFKHSWNTYLSEKKAIVTNERHLPTLRLHRKKTNRSVLLIHGIFDSPQYQKSIAHYLFNQGYNVLAILLPGHWEADSQALEKLDSTRWSTDVDRGFEMAKELGGKVFVVGYSLGGLLAVEQALKRTPAEIAGLALIAPALKIQKKVHWVTYFGREWGLDGNIFARLKPDGFDIPYYSPFSVPRILETQERIFPENDRMLLYSKISLPVFLVYTKLDEALDTRETEAFFGGISSIEKGLKKFTIASKVDHIKIAKGPGDAHLANPQNYNPHFQEMINEIGIFLKHF